MGNLDQIAELKSGSPQFRIVESSDDGASTYSPYGQAELEADLAGIRIENAVPDERQRLIRTKDQVSTLESGDLVFSLISGKSAIVSPYHKGYLFTQNYVKLTPSESIDIRYLAYLLNESDEIKRQLLTGLQGTVTLKYTISQLAHLKLPFPPPLETQKTLGELYFNQLKLEALKKRQAALETKLVMERMKGAIRQ